jgi:hypothetical protein
MLIKLSLAWNLSFSIKAQKNKSLHWLFLSAGGTPLIFSGKPLTLNQLPVEVYVYNFLTKIIRISTAVDQVPQSVIKRVYCHISLDNSQVEVAGTQGKGYSAIQRYAPLPGINFMPDNAAEPVTSARYM